MNRNCAREEEFEQAAMIHTESLLRAALRLSDSRMSAEDLVQESLLRAWRAFEQYEAGTDCKAWLFRILFNCAKERRRRWLSRPKLVSFEDCAGRDAEMMRGEETADDHAEVIAAFDTLAEDHRVVLLLAIVEGFTAKEIAGLINVPMGTVMSRLSRARERLRQALTGEQGEEASARKLKLVAGRDNNNEL